MHPLFRILLGALLIGALWPVVTVAPVAAQSSVRSIGFEDEPDGLRIGDGIAGMRFSSSGQPWRFADVRSGAYNAPYPNDCPAFSGPCAYAVRGNGFAWLGAAGGSGTISFTSGPATSVSAAFSTAGTLTITAYDPDGGVIANRTVAPNIRTGRLDSVTFTAPAIAAITIDGSANGWIMDDLEVSAPADPLVSDRVVPPPLRHPALITVVQRVTAPEQVLPGSELTLTLVATNRGRGAAADTQITVPLDQTHVQLQEATFSRAGAWVRAIGDQAITLQTGALHSSGDTLTATLRLRITGDAADGSRFGEPLAYRWRDAVAGGSGQSNRLELIVGRAAPPPVAELQPIDPEANGRMERFTAAVYAPNEPVALWYDDPTGRSVAYGRVIADQTGAIDVAFAPADLPAGVYRLVATGVWSEQVAATEVRAP